MPRRVNKEGSIFEQKKPRKDGSIYARWCCEVITGYDKDNKKIVKRIYGDSQQEVLEAKNNLLVNQQKGLLPKTKGITLNQYIEHWLELKKNTVKAKTYESYLHTSESTIKESIGKTPIQKITTAQLNTFFAEIIRKGYSNASVKRYRAVLSNIMNTAIDEEVLAVNPVVRCKIGKSHETSAEISILTQEEIKILLTKAKEIYNKKGVKLKFLYHMVLLALATGCRRGELAALKWDNVNFDNNTISIVENLVEVKGGVLFDTPKSKSSKRTIAVANTVMDELAEYKQQTNTCDLVFHTNSSKPISPSNIARGFRFLISEVEIPHHVRFHDLRHSHCCQLLNSGINIKQVSVRLGHENIQITLQIYSHFIPAQDRNAADIMGNILLLPTVEIR